MPSVREASSPSSPHRGDELRYGLSRKAIPDEPIPAVIGCPPAQQPLYRLCRYGGGQRRSSCRRTRFPKGNIRHSNGLSWKSARRPTGRRRTSISSIPPPSCIHVAMSVPIPTASRHASTCMTGYGSHRRRHEVFP